MTPMQAYWSALPFAPSKSVLRNIFNLDELIPGVIRFPKVPDQWDAVLQTLEGQRGSIESVEFLTDGKTLASASSDYTICLWDAATGVLLQTLEGHTLNVASLAFNGKVLASGSSDCTVKLWDPDTGVLLRTLEGHTECVRSVAFQGGLLASSSGDRTIKIWDTATGDLLRTLEGHTAMVDSVAFNGKILASGSRDRTVKLWDPNTGILLRTLEEHTYSFHCVAFNGGILAAGSGDHMIKIWDTTTGNLLRKLEGHADVVLDIQFSDDGKTLASASGDRKIMIWDTLSGAVLQTLKGHMNWVFSVRFSVDGKTLASGSSDCTVRIWDLSTETSIQQMDSGEDRRSISPVVFSLDGKKLASVWGGGEVGIWDPDTAVLQCSWQTIREGENLYERKQHRIEEIGFSADGKALMTQSLGHGIKVWDVATGELLSGPAEYFESNFKTIVDYNPLLESYTIRVLETYTGAEHRVFTAKYLPRTIYLAEEGRHTFVEREHFEFQTKHSTSAMAFEGGWLMQGENRLIRLPSGYRPSLNYKYYKLEDKGAHNHEDKGWDVYGNTICLGCPDSRLSYITFQNTRPYPSP
ncbi:Beta-TrCP [Arthrobotrys entomopaga]|nr:Beta-TrCP [Arthrobotrys entomopaga]